MPGQHGSTGAPRQLPPVLQLHILSLLPPNDRALSGRLVSSDAADGLSVKVNCTAFLSQPLPPHAVAWALEAGQQHVQQLPFLHKLQLLCTAARSGSEVNLEVALALLQPSIFPELLQSYDCSAWRHHDSVHCPGEAAAKAGHPQLLGWLVRRCPWLVWPGRALRAAARHCDLAGLQVAWQALQHGFGSSSSNGSGLCPELSQGMLDGAAESSTPDAVAKIEWALMTVANGAGGGGAEGSPCCRLQLTTAAAAARTGDLGRLQWLRDQGCPMGREPGWVLHLDGPDVLEVALQYADLAVAQWLAREGGCGLPKPAANGEEDGGWFALLHALAGSCVDAAAKLAWLLEQGAPPLEYDGASLQLLARAAIGAGQVEVLRMLPGLWTTEGMPYLRYAMSGAASRGAPARWCVPMASYLQQSGWVFSHEEYLSAARGGHVGMVTWLAREAGVSADGLDLCRFVEAWPGETPSDSRGLMEAVQVLVREAGWRVRDAGTKRLLLTATLRGELGLVQYLLQEIGEQQEQRRQQQEQELQELQPEELEHLVEGEEQEDMLQVGYPSDCFGILAAARSGCEALLEFVVGQLAGTPDAWFSSPYIEPAKRGDRGTLEALRRLGVPWGTWDMAAAAVKAGCAGPGLRWLVEQG